MIMTHQERDQLIHEEINRFVSSKISFIMSSLAAKINQTSLITPLELILLHRTELLVVAVHIYSVMKNISNKKFGGQMSSIQAKIKVLILYCFATRPSRSKNNQLNLLVLFNKKKCYLKSSNIRLRNTGNP